MTTIQSSKCKAVHEKLSGYIDGELTQQDTQFVRVHLSQCNECQETLNDVLASRGHLKNALLSTPGDSDGKFLVPAKTDKPSMVLQWLGWPLLIIGALLITTFLGWQFLVDDSVPVWVRIASLSILSGTILLLIAVLRQRLISQKTDKYKGVSL